MVRRMVSMLASLALALTAVGAVNVAPALAACGASGTYYVMLAEDLSGGGDKLCVALGAQGNGQSNLGNIAHTPVGSCSATVKIGDNWNDCISSVKVMFPTSGTDRCVRLYDGPSYTYYPPNPAYMVQYWELQNSGWNNLSGSLNDKLTSLRFGNWTGSTCDVTP